MRLHRMTGITADMKHRFCILAWLAASLTGCESPTPAGAEAGAAPWQVERAVQEAWSRKHPGESLKRVESQPVAGLPGWFVAICDTEPHWWGTFLCFEFKDGRVTRYAEIIRPEENAPTEQSIDSIDTYLNDGVDGAIVEVWGITHKGHGNLYVYALMETRLHCLAMTFAVDGHMDLDLIRGGKLTRRLVDVNGDGYVDIELTGVIDLFDEKGEQLIESRPCRKVLLWVSDQQRFIEDRSLREGFESYGDR